MASRHRSTRRSARIVGLLALALLIGVVAGGASWLLNNREAGPSSEPSANEPPSDDPPAPSDDPTPSAEDEGEDTYANSDAREGPGADLGELPDGDHFGFVSEVTVHAVTFEPAELLTGEGAQEAARQDGTIGPGDDLPNDFYIRYQDTAELALPLAAEFEASLLDNSDLSETRKLDAASMADLYTGDLDAPWMYGQREHLPVVLRIEDGEVVRADEHYLP